ncbi:MAG: alpha/beta fold hydrolase [Parasphingorhabdus sp.]|uniref:alpha/beta fold hydrolase n=1 Tax=Parasphingorhabdus sp. TaxID=2709688 RepID=UPI00329754DF
MKCDYVNLPDGRQVHYRRAGSGPAMILLHPSPQCSEAMVPALTAFSQVCSCFALDTPGYGLSDDIPEMQPDMGDYADSVIATADALGMDQFYLYGAATGSQVAIELGKRYPSRIKLMMLDSNGHVPDDERERLMDGYFPDVTPRRDGGHLLTYWDMCRHLFVAFPWQSDRIEDRLGIPLPPVEVTQMMLLRYLRAGTQYAKAYRPAFQTEKRSHMDGLTVPATIMRWEASIALAITDALINLGVPESMEVLHAGPTIDERFSVQVEKLRQTIADHGDATAFEPMKTTALGSGFERRYYPSGGHQIHAQILSAAQGKPIIFLHDALQSSDQMRDLAKKFANNRPAILVDLPGHGATMMAVDEPSLSLSSLTENLVPVIRAISDGPVDIVGVGLGAAIGIKLADHITVDHLRIVDPIAFTPSEQAAFAEAGLIDIAPKPDGSHLISAWAMMVDDEFFWPWFDKSPKAARSVAPNLSPSYLHEKLVRLLRVGAHYPAFASLQHGLDWPALLRSAATDIEIVSTARYPCPERLPALDA